MAHCTYIFIHYNNAQNSVQIHVIDEEAKNSLQLLLSSSPRVIFTVKKCYIIFFQNRFNLLVVANANTKQTRPTCPFSPIMRRRRLFVFLFFSFFLLFSLLWRRNRHELSLIFSLILQRILCLLYYYILPTKAPSYII